MPYSPNYIPAVLRENVTWYIEYSYMRSDGTMQRVRNNLNRILKRIAKKSEKRSYAQTLVSDLNKKLASGWTPELSKVSQTNPYASTPWEQVSSHYLSYLSKSDNPDKISHATCLTYKSTFTIFCSFLPDCPYTFKYIYHLNQDVVKAFLNWSLSKRHVSTTTRDNYRRWLHSFCSWLVSCGYLTENPVEQVKALGGGHHLKQKDIDSLRSKYISQHDRDRMFAWMQENDKRLLLAVYLCHYCFLRTKEVSMLRIENIRLHDSLIYVPATISKNKTDAYITLPDEVAKLMLDLDLFSHPSHWFIFNRQLLPEDRKKPIRGDEIRERWRVMCNTLGYPKTVWYYHLKHTGITDMTDVMPEKLVQQQARHHSITMTERYIQPKKPSASKEIKSFGKKV